MALVPPVSLCQGREVHRNETNPPCSYIGDEISKALPPVILARRVLDPTARAAAPSFCRRLDPSAAVQQEQSPRGSSWEPAGEAGSAQPDD